MVQYCKTCEVSHNEGTECDCGYLAVGGEYFPKPGQPPMMRVSGTRWFDGLCAFIASGRWDGKDAICVVGLAQEEMGYPAVGYTSVWIRRYIEANFAQIYPDEYPVFVRQLFDASCGKLPELLPDLDLTCIDMAGVAIL